MESSAFIGSSIFLYIVAFLAVMVVGRKQQRKDKRDRD
jgi:hypothetical protein